MTSPLSPEAVAQMVADRDAGTPGPWTFEIDEDTQEPRLYGDGSLIAVFGNHMSMSEASWIPEADARRATRIPDLEAAYLTLAAENATLRQERYGLIITQAWTEGEPPKYIRNEWFIAKTIHGGRVVLRALQEEHSYDYMTKDETYMIAKHIKAWMQFPDSNYRSFAPSDYDALRASEAAARDALTKLRDLMCEGIEDDDGNSGCGQCADECTGCIAHAALTPTTDKEPKT